MIRGRPKTKQRREVKNSGYSDGGASLLKKTLKTWLPRHYSAKEDIDRNLSTLRDRAHDLAINSAVGAAAINAQSTNVVGVGLKLFPRINAKLLGLTPEAARDWSRKVKQEFDLWAKSALACDFLRRNNFYELQRISFTSYLVDGDNFCLFRRRPPTEFNPYSLRLQLIDAQRVSNPTTNAGFGAVSNIEMQKLNSRNRIINGIEVDGEGAQVAIWISNRIWNEATTLVPELKWQRVRWYGRDTGIRNVLHICADVRPDQFRGVPLLAPVIEPLKQISRYADAELTSAIIKSFFSIFFVQPLSNLEVANILGEDEDEGKPIVDVNEYRLGPATMAALPKGVDVKAIDSSNAQSTFDAFTGSFLKQVGAATNIPYEVLLKSFTASYSASRAALLQAADEFRQRKGWFVADFCAPVYEQWLSEAVAIGRIDAPGFFEDPLRRAAWTGADWFNEASHFLDPVKETQAMIMRLQSGLSTYSAEIANATGQDFDDVIETLSQERELVAKLPPLPMTEAGQVSEGEDDNGDSEDDDEDERERERLRRRQKSSQENAGRA